MFGKTRKLEIEILGLKYELKRVKDELETYRLSNDMLDTVVKAKDISEQHLNRLINTQIHRIKELEDSVQIMYKNNNHLISLVEDIKKENEELRSRLL